MSSPALPCRVFALRLRRVRMRKGVLMRLFSLFLRRAGVQPAPVRKPSNVSRLTVICPRHQLADIRKQIYANFQAAGLKIQTLTVDHAAGHEMSSACVTVLCPPAMRPALMSQARRLRDAQGVHQVHWGDRRHIALN